jgi:hypothetical protein
MRLVRTMMAFLIALSVAMLPTAGSAVSVVSSASQAESQSMFGNDMAMASSVSGAMDERCPDLAKTKPCDQSSDQCPMAFCAAQLVSLASTGAFHFDFPVRIGSALLIPLDQVVSLHGGSPPFRPPQI